MRTPSPGCVARPAAQHGVTLVEVLVALAIFAFASVGLALLQIAALRSHRVTWERGTAAALAAEMAEHMHANRVVAQHGAYLATSTRCPIAPVLTSAALADCDLQRWRNDLAVALPSGTGEVTAAGAGQYRIAVRWIDKDFHESSAPCVVPAAFSDNLPAQRYCCPDGSAAGLRCFNLPVVP